MSSLSLYLAALAALGLERLNELRLSRRNARWAFARGGREVGQRHFGIMATVHGAFLVSCAVEASVSHRPCPAPLAIAGYVGALLAQSLRAWAITTLGRRWNTRIIVLDDQPPVTIGPYRFVRHPNYVAVIQELLFVPLAHAAYATMVVFTAANAALLFVRIRAEEGALGSSYATAFANRPRFLPEAFHGDR